MNKRKTLPGSGIKSIRYKENVGRGEVPKIGILRDILADKTICVFVGASLARGIRMRRINICIQCQNNSFMNGRHFSIVAGDCMYWQTIQKRIDRIRNDCFGAVMNQVNTKKAAFTIHQPNDSALITLANDGVCFPITVSPSNESGFQFLYHWDYEGQLMTISIQCEEKSVVSIASICPAANWIERETRDYFGVKFNNREKISPIVLRPGDPVGLFNWDGDTGGLG